ncbi:MAG: hypothetical protein AAFU85_16020 [Planctomycetota bacterium]
MISHSNGINAMGPETTVADERTLPTATSVAASPTLFGRIRDGFVDQQFAAPGVAILLVTVCYVLSGWFEFQSITAIAPVVAVTGLWMSLSTTRGFGAVLALAATFLWLFVLWYAMVQPASTATGAFRQAPSLDFWRFQATFLAIVGCTTITVILLRVFTRIRLTPQAELEWSNSCRWGLLDLMALSFGIAMVVAATNLRGDIPTIVLSAIVSITFTLCVAFFWWSLSLRGPMKWIVISLALPLQAYVGAIALNSIAPIVWDSYSYPSLVNRLPVLAQSDLVAVIGFFLLMSLPPLSSIVMGQRLVAFPTGKPSGLPTKAFAAISIGLLTVAPIAGSFFTALAPWQRAETVRTAGWPFYYTELSERLAEPNSPSASLITHVALNSNLRLSGNVVLAMVPLLLIAIWWLHQRRTPDKASRSSPWVLPAFAFAWFFFVYFCPSLMVQQFANRAASGGFAPAVSALTQRFDDSLAKRRGVVGRAFAIGDAETLDHVFSTPGGARLTSVHLLDLRLTQSQLDRLASNHALVSLELTRCEVMGTFDAFVGHPHLERLTLTDTEIDSQAQAVLSQCPSLLSVNLMRPKSVWTSWPKTLKSIWIGCDKSTPTEWVLSDLPRLDQFMMADSAPWDDEPSENKPRQQPPRRLSMIRCGAPNLSIGNVLPIHLRIQGTELVSLWGIPSYTPLADDPVARDCDLRSFECDDISKLTTFQACVADCESFVLRNPSGTVAGASVRIEGTRLPSQLRLDFDPIGPQDFPPMGRDDSDRILKPIIEVLQPIGLKVIGMTVTSKQLERLANVANPGEVEIQGTLLADHPIQAIGALKSLLHLKLVGVAPTDSELSSLLASLPQLAILEMDGHNLRSPNLSNSPSLSKLSLLTERIPTFRRADIRRLNSLVVGSQFAEPQFMTNVLLVTDSEVSALLLNNWLGTHKDVIVDLKNAMKTMQPLRGLDFSKTERLSIATTPPDIDVMKTWSKGHPSRTQFYEQQPEAVGNGQLRAWLRTNLDTYFLIVGEDDLDREYGQ